MNIDVIVKIFNSMHIFNFKAYCIILRLFKKSSYLF